MIDLLAATPPGAPLGAVDPPGLVILRDRGVPVIDIRRAYEWEATGVIAGSNLLTFFDERGTFDLDGWLAALAPLAGPGDPFVLVCRLAQRTDVLGRYLSGVLGYRRACHLVGGITWWLDRGFPVVVPDEAAGPGA